MRRPWFEAGPALAAAGLSLTPDPDAPVTGSIWTQPMIDLAAYAFLTRIDATTKPTAFPDLHHLARHIERRRLDAGADRSIQLEEVEDLQFAGQPGLHTGVQVWLLDMAHEREASLGYAWLKGDGRERLEPVLRTARRDLAGHQRLAA
jgi:hypothetical protein